MKIGVLLKNVPDTETKVRLRHDGKGIDEDSVKWIVNPFDEYAIEEALRLKDKSGGEVVIISVGTKKAREIIKIALAMGADRGILAKTERGCLDSYLTSVILSEIISSESFDIIFAGRQATDDDNGQIVQRTASLLGWPSLPVIEEFNYSDGKAVVLRSLQGDAKERLEVLLPAIFGCEKDLNKPRYATLPGIIKAKSKPIVDIDVEQFITGKSSKIEIKSYSVSPERRTGKVMRLSPVEAASEFVRFLREDVKIG